MQKLIYTGLFLFFLNNESCNAQRPTSHEIQLSYGPMAREQVLDDAVTNFFRSLFRRSLPQLDFSNSYTVTYRYQARRRLAIGMMSGITTGTSYSTYFPDSRSFYKHTSAIMAFETKFSYTDRSLLTLYAVTGFGGLLVQVKDQRLQNKPKTYAWPTCQLTPFGIRYGRKLGGFAEIGYGYKGIVNLGLSARF